MRILTGVKPTDSQIHIGNYFGAIKPMMQLAEKFKDAEIFLFLANMHGFTYVHDGKEIKQNSLNVLKLYAACGVDMKRFIIYNPAEIPGHAQLNWVLTCLTHMGFMERMHSYKEALDKGNAKNISVGTFCYPILMAADILLYDTDIVPVGKDQKQHVEYARDIAIKFNAAYGETFKIPDVYTQEDVGLILGIDGRKMSKSYNNYIGLLDDEKTILKRVKQIPTSTQTVEEPKNPDECNVYKICKLFLTPEEDEILRKRYQAGGLSYKDAKDYLYEKIIAFVQPIQKKYAEISDQEIIDLVKKNTQKVNELAQKKIENVYKKVGFTL
ncbi:MAG: tryptophan--tRNA ligase [candidate division SR1 bacterium]|nr:tryptophan--tRNA ligase [candidate division SR1 bacterium]